MAREMHGLCSADAPLRFHSQLDWLLPNAATALHPTRSAEPQRMSDSCLSHGNPLPSGEKVQRGMRDFTQVCTLVPHVVTAAELEYAIKKLVAPVSRRIGKLAARRRPPQVSSYWPTGARKLARRVLRWSFSAQRSIDKYDGLGAYFNWKKEEIDVPANEAGQFAKGGALDSPPNLPKRAAKFEPLYQQLGSRTTGVAPRKCSAQSAR
jgi:hypothetical protein